MGKLWDLIKITFFVVLIFVMLRIAFSEKYFGDVPFELVLMVGIIILVMFGIYFLKWWPIRKKMAPNNDDITYLTRAIAKVQASGRKVPATITDSGYIEYPPGYDGMVIGDHFWFRYEENVPNVGRVSKNVFYDALNDRIRGTITADDLHSRPSERIKAATHIIQLLRSGEVPSQMILPETVERVIERESQTQKENEENEGK